MTKAYPNDLTWQQWELIADLFPEARTYALTNYTNNAVIRVRTKQAIASNQKHEKEIIYQSVYSSKDNIKFFKNNGLTFLTGIAKNRSCSVDGKNFTQVQNLEIPDTGKMRASKKLWTSESI